MDKLNVRAKHLDKMLGIDKKRAKVLDKLVFDLIEDNFGGDAKTGKVGVACYRVIAQILESRKIKNKRELAYVLFPLHGKCFRYVRFMRLAVEHNCVIEEDLGNGQKRYTDGYGKVVDVSL